MKKLFTFFICLCAIVALQAQTATAPSNAGEANAGESSNPYMIASLENLYWITASDLVVASPNQATRWAAYYKQTADIVASATSTWFSNGSGGYYGWPTIGGASGDFTGTYDGQGHAISGLYINRTEYTGFFGSIKGATIKNLGVTNVTITGDANGTGALVGYAYNLASTVSNCFSSGFVTGTTNVGGLIGLFDIQTHQIKDCYSSCSVTGTNDIGGLAGNSNTSNVERCYARGSVSASGTTHIGGLIGYSPGGTVSNCFWDTQTSGQSNSAGGTGQTTAEMKTASTFTGAAWSTTDWQLVDGAYPILIWAPTMQASAISFSAVTSTGMTISWTKGNGSSRAVFVKEGSGPITNPVDKTTYAASTNCSSTQSQLGSSGYYCIYNGTGDLVTIYGQLPNTQYTVQMFEYNGVEGFQKYLTTTATNNPNSQTTLMPTITSATYDAATGVLVLTCTNIATDDDINPTKMTLTGEGGTTYTLSTAGVKASSSTSVSITLNDADKAAINQIFNKNGTSSIGSTAYNLAAADDWDANVTITADIADQTGNAITVSNVAAPTITSATYDAVTGALVVTGTGFLSRSGSTNDIDVSKLTITGEGETTYTLTSPGVEITSGTSFTVTLNETDKTSVNQIANKNGTSSTGGTAYNLAASENWAAGADAGVDVADLTGNGITVSNLASPTVTTQAVTSIGSTTATGNGNITDLGVPNPTQYGVVWSTSTNPIVSLSTKTTQGTASATGAFTSGITGLAAGTTYYVKAYATNSVGTVYGDEVNFTTITVPDAPTIGTATAGDTQVSVSFVAPASNGGSVITSYTVTSDPGSLTGTGTASPIIVTGLTNGTPYTFTVTATNSAGTSIASAVSNSVTPNESQTITFANPGAQTFGTSPTLSATASSGLSVTFTTSTSDVCSITSDGVLTFKKAGSCTILADQAGNAAYIAAPTVSQTFTVNAVTPGAPTIGTVTPGDGQASVGFTAPASTGGADVTYTVTSSPESLTGTGTASPITVVGLTNGTTYTFTVTATNSAGTSIASAVSNSVTAYSAPTVTTDAAGDITSSGVTLKGTVTANGASTAVTFEYGTTDAYGTSVTATQSPVTEIAGIAVSKAITGLTANTTYHYRVVGVNAGGTTNGLDQTFKTDLGTGLLDNAIVTVLSLYPNPATEGFYVNVGEKTTLISISDLNGCLILAQQVTGKSYININLLQKGVYVVKVNGLVAKLVKK
jgi:hypothetical protein